MQTTINPILENAILAKIMEHGISLFVLPDIAIMAQKEAESENGTVSGLVRIISGDPVITARLLQVSNSSMYRGLERVDSLSHVVTRLGMKTVSHLIISLFTQQLFRSNVRMLVNLMRERYLFSARVAAHAFYIASSHNTKVDPNQAMIAGLLHGIGGLPVIAIAEEIPKLQQAPELMNALIDSLQSRLGVKIMQSWDFPEMFVDVVRKIDQRDRVHEGAADLIDVIIAAIAQVKDDKFLPDGTLIPAFIAIGEGSEQPQDEDRVIEMYQSLI